MSPSATASAAERQCSRRGSDKGFVGVDFTHHKPREGLLAVLGEGYLGLASAILTHVSLSELGSTSDFLRTLRLPTSMTHADAAMCRSGMVRVTTALLSRLKRKRCHTRANVVQSAWRAVEVGVQGGCVRPEVMADGGGPIEQSEAGLCWTEGLEFGRLAWPACLPPRAAFFHCRRWGF